MEWISVKDRLPEDDTKKYLIYAIKYKVWSEFNEYTPLITIGSWDHENIFGQDFGIQQSDGISLVVTHWMPLPEPPKG